MRVTPTSSQTIQVGSVLFDLIFIPIRMGLLLAMLDHPGWRKDMGRLARGALGRHKRGHWDTTVANAWGVLAMEKFSASFENVPVSGMDKWSLRDGMTVLVLPATNDNPWAGSDAGYQLCETIAPLFFGPLLVLPTDDLLLQVTDAVNSILVQLDPLTVPLDTVLTTLIGTPPNLIVSGFRAQNGGGSFTMFDFTPVGLAVAVASAALCAWAAFSGNLQSFSGVEACDPTSPCRGELRSYQKEGLGWLHFLRQFNFGGCLADDMGVGKTAQVLALLETRRAARAVWRLQG